MQITQISREPYQFAIVDAIKDYLRQHNYNDTLQAIEVIYI